MKTVSYLSVAALIVFLISPLVNPLALTTPPPIPTSLQASDGTYTDRIHLTWSGSTGATYYEVYRATSSGGSRTHLGHATTTQYDDTTAKAGTKYWFWVNACDASNVCSKLSSYDTGTRAAASKPAVPTGLSASDGTYVDRVTLTWTAVSGADYYEVYRATSATGSRTHLGHATSPTYDDKSATAGKTYTYWVNACTSANLCSALSSPDSGYRATSTETRPGIPSYFKASDGAYLDRVSLSWNYVQYASYYEVYRAESATGSRTHLGHATAVLTYDDTTAAPGKTYTYWVNACTASNLCSALSTPDTGFASICQKVEGTPTLLKPANGSQEWGTYEDDQIDFGWSALPNISHYELVITDTATGLVKKDLIEEGTGENLWGLGPGVYTWHVRALHPAEACNAPGDWSETWQFTMNFYPPPGPVSNLTASQGTYAGLVRLAWDPPASGDVDIYNYDIFRADSLTGDQIRIGIADWSDTSYDDSSVVTGQTYYYWVSACGYATGCGEKVGGVAGFAAAP